MATARKAQREAAREELRAREAAERERARGTQRLWQIGAAFGGALVVVIVAIAISSSGGSGAGSSKGPAAGRSGAQALFAGIAQEGTTAGNPAATVTLTEYADLQCPFCRDYTLSLLPSIVTKYVRTGRVKMVFRGVAIIGRDSVPADLAAYAAGMQNKLWDFVDVWYHNQGEENSGYVTTAFVRKIARAVPGLSVGKLLRDAGSSTAQRELQQAQSLFDNMNLGGTPTFFVQRTGGGQREVDDASELDGALSRALAGA